MGTRLEQFRIIMGDTGFYTKAKYGDLELGQCLLIFNDMYGIPDDDDITEFVGCFKSEFNYNDEMCETIYNYIKEQNGKIKK